MNISKVRINKNRGWRGLAEVVAFNDHADEVNRMIFSFSPEVWDDLMDNKRLVMQDDEYYYILAIDDPLNRLPVGHQRSVLIKNFIATVPSVIAIKKDHWTETQGDEYRAINIFRKNRNNHTTSDWNCIRNKSYTKHISLCTKTYVRIRGQKGEIKHVKSCKKCINI